MTVLVPTVDAAYAAVMVELNAIAPAPGTFLHYDQYLDDDQELIEKYQTQDETAECNLFLVLAPIIEESEGQAAGEKFDAIKFRIRYLSVISMDPQWSRIAQTKAELVRDAISGNTNIFAIGGRRQLVTPETVQIEELGKKPIGKNQVYEANITFKVEARRWS